MMNGKLRTIKEKFQNKNKWDMCFMVLTSAIFFIILFCYKDGIDGDTIGDLLIAHKAAATGKPFPENFYYSTTLPILFGNIGLEEILAHLGLGFYNTFLVVRVCEMVIYSILLWWILNLAGVGERKLIIWTILMLPSRTYSYMLYLCGYYVWALMVPVLLMCMYKLYNDEVHQKRRLLIWLGASCISFTGGLFGVKTLMWVFVPLTLALLIQGLCFKSKNDTYKFAGGIMLPAIVGYFINEKVLLGRYGISSRMELKYSPLAELADRFGRTINEILKVLGWQEEAELISAAGIVNVAVLISVLFIIVIVTHTIKNWGDISEFDRVIFLFTAINFACSVFLQIFTKTDLNGTYLTPSIWSVLFSSCIFYFKYDYKRFDEKIKWIFVCILLFFYVFSWKNIYTIYVTDMRARVEERNTISEVLEKNGYEYGYATFWNSMPIIASSNLQIESVNINITDDGINYFQWLSPKEWYDKEYYKGTVFILLDKNEREIFDSMVKDTEKAALKVVFEDSIYTIYETENENMIKYITN